MWVQVVFRLPFFSLLTFGVFSAVLFGSERFETFSYGEHARQNLDVLSPRGSEKAPVVVFVHGGGWIHGNKSLYHPVQSRLASEGIVTVSINYRLCPEVTFPEFVEDGAMAVKWTVRNIDRHGGDPNNIFLMGHSAGGHTVAMLGLDESYLEGVGVERKRIRGVIPISAPLMLRTSEVPSLSLIFGEASDAEMWPLAFIDGGEPPFLLIQGENDPLVRPFHAREAERRIREGGGSATAVLFAGHDHMSVVSAIASTGGESREVIEPVLNLILGKP